MVPEFNTEHLGYEFSLPDGVEELTLSDVYVGLEIPLLAPGDGIVTDRHHASADRYEADYPQNQIGGMVSPFPLSEWLRHGCELIVQAAGDTACRPGAADTEYIITGGPA